MSLFATAALGTEDLVAAELSRLGMAGVRRVPGGVELEGRLAEGMRACLQLRAAMRVLMPLGRFVAEDADALHAGAEAIPWEAWLTRKSTFAVSATTRAAPPFAHAPFLAQKVKDGVVDRLRARIGNRPDVSRDDPDVQLYVHVDAKRQVTVGLDLCGDSLHMRGYRVAKTAAPMRETLAAAVLLAAGFAAERPLVDPMCGSGTIVIEAALMACRIAPGRRRRFGFQRWPAFGDAEQAAWRGLLEEADGRALARAPVPLLGSDRDREAVVAATRNAAAAGPAVAASIAWREADAREVAPTEPPGMIVSNAPYGERLSGKGLEGFFRSLGARLRTLDGHTAFLLGNEAMSRVLGMRPTWTRRLMNGPIGVTLHRYELGRQHTRRRS